MSRVIRPCPICAADNADLCLENPMAAVGGFDMSYTVVRCQRCGFHYARELADQATFSAYYQSVSKYDNPGEIAPVDLARIQATVHFLEKHVGKSQRIADLGCGYGALLGHLKQAGWSHLQGLDPAPNAAKCAKQMFGIDDVSNGTLSNAHEALNLQKVDLVCIMCVLEHLPHLKADMARLLTHLRPGSKVLIEVPAAEFFPHPHTEPYGEFSLEHIQYFDAPSLNNLMCSLGAEPVAVELLPLPMASSGSMLGLFTWSGTVPSAPQYQHPVSEGLAYYIASCRQQLSQALSRIPASKIIVYGAGSHTARLLGHLERKSGCEVIGIVDSNPNLTGKKMGRWTVRPPSSLQDTPDIPVLVSSFRSQNAIAAQLKQSVANPLVLMYP